MHRLLRWRYIEVMDAKKPRQLANPVTRSCERCRLAISGQSNRRFCSANCKRLAWDKNRRVTWRASQQRPLNSNWGRTPGQCKICGAAFVGHKDKRYCSVRCGDRARRPARREYDRQRAHAYRLANRSRLSANRKTERSRAKARAYARLYRMEHRETLVAYEREYRRRNAERLRESGRRRYDRVRELRRQSSKRWAEEHAAVHAHNQAVRRARQRAAAGSHTLSEWLRLLEEGNNRCFYCGLQSGELTRDHDVPLVRGGSHGISNIRPACASCNARKGRSTGAEFRARLARNGMTTRR